MMKKIILIITAMVVVGSVHAVDASSEQEDVTVHFSEFSLILKPSSLGGVGVFALHDITAGTVIFDDTLEMRVLKMSDIPQELIKYCILVSDEECVCPGRFDRMEIGWYMNHSNNPNILCTITDFEVCKFCAVRDIKAGDELVMDYRSLGEPEHLKESFYQSAE